MLKSIYCWKCCACFTREARLNKHAETCKGKICRVCGQRGHLACGISISGDELKARIQAALQKGPVTVVGLFND